MQFHHKPPFNRGLTILSPRNRAQADMLMDFGALVLAGRGKRQGLFPHR
jgi:hypothetical protein